MQAVAEVQTAAPVAATEEMRVRRAAIAKGVQQDQAPRLDKEVLVRAVPVAERVEVEVAGPTGSLI